MSTFTRAPARFVTVALATQGWSMKAMNPLRQAVIETRQRPVGRAGRAEGLGANVAADPFGLRSYRDLLDAYQVIARTLDVFLDVPPDGPRAAGKGRHHQHGQRDRAARAETSIRPSAATTGGTIGTDFAFLLSLALTRFRLPVPVALPCGRSPGYAPGRSIAARPGSCNRARR